MLSFWVFAGEHYCSSGGWGNFKGAYETFEEAIASIEDGRNGEAQQCWDWAEIVNIPERIVHRFRIELDDDEKYRAEEIAKSPVYLVKDSWKINLYKEEIERLRPSLSRIPDRVEAKERVIDRKVNSREARKAALEEQLEAYKAIKQKLKEEIESDRTLTEEEESDFLDSIGVIHRGQVLMVPVGMRKENLQAHFFQACAQIEDTLEEWHLCCEYIDSAPSRKERAIAKIKQEKREAINKIAQLEKAIAELLKNS